MFEYKRRLVECKSAWMYHPFYTNSNIKLRYYWMKETFRVAQRYKDLLWSSDSIIDSCGNFVGVRLNKNFFKRSEVKRQLQAASKYFK